MKKICERIGHVFKVLKWLVLSFVLMCFVTPNLCMPWISVPLLQDDHPQRNADFVIVLMGDASVRPKKAAEAVLEGYAPQLMMIDSQSNAFEEAGLVPRESVMALQMIGKAGLDHDQVLVLKDVGRMSSTAEEALAYRHYFKTHPLRSKRLIVVTSWFHTSRASWIFEKAFANEGISIEMMPVYTLSFHPEDWWKSEQGMITIFEEYIKWARYIYKFAGRALE